MYSRKRKQRPEYRRREDSHNGAASSAPDAALFVVAHEADVVRGPQATLAAQSLEVVQYLPGQPPRKNVGHALIRWGASSGFGRQPDVDEDDHRVRESHDGQGEIWVDRYVILDRPVCRVQQRDLVYCLQLQCD